MTRAAANSTSTAATVASDDPRYTAVDIPPNVLLYLTQLAVRRGLACDDWFAGMGLQRGQLSDPSLRASYRQASTVIRRAIQDFREVDLGLSVGCSETPGSFGLLGLAMTTSRTFGDAMRVGLEHHKVCGALLDFTFEAIAEREVALMVWPRFGEAVLLPFLCEELFASSMMLARQLAGAEFRPTAVELAYPAPAYAARYDEIFECPVRFGMPRSRVRVDMHWLARELPGYNPLTAQQALALYLQTKTGTAQPEIVAAVEQLLRSRLHQPPTMAEIARNFDTFNRGDYDGTNHLTTYLDTTNIEHNNSWYQEFKLAGNTDLIEWVAGVSFYDEQARQTNVYTDSIDTLALNVGGAAYTDTFAFYDSVLQSLDAPWNQYHLLGDPWRAQINNEGHFNAYAAYGDVIWHLTDRLNLTTGARFTRDERQFSWFNPPRQAPALDQTITALLPLLNAFGIDPAVFQQNLIFNAASGAPVGILVKSSNSWNDLSPRAVLDYKFTPNVMGYASVTKGYKAGGYNSVQIGSYFAPEKVWNYEAGIKTVFPEQNLLLNASAYYYRYNNRQSLTLDANSTGSGVPRYLVSSSDQQASGAELELQWQPVDALRLGLNAAYIDATYRHDIAPSGANLDGHENTRSPPRSPIPGTRWPTATWYSTCRMPTGAGRAATAIRSCRAPARSARISVSAPPSSAPTRGWTGVPPAIAGGGWRCTSPTCSTSATSPGSTTSAPACSARRMPASPRHGCGGSSCVRGSDHPRSPARASRRRPVTFTHAAVAYASCFAKGQPA